jgi:hypothetical protein
MNSDREGSPAQAKTIRIFVSSQGGVEEERDKTEAVIRDFNNREKTLMLHVRAETINHHSELQP